MTYDFKKDKMLYPTKTIPTIVKVSRLNFIAVRGKGNPNEEGGAYKQAVEKLYSMAYAIKMSKKGNDPIQDYYDFVVPPLEGFWWQDDIKGIDYTRKDDFNFISLLRLPDYVTLDVFNDIKHQVKLKKKINLDNVEYFTYDEGLVVQCLHIGSYDNEPETTDKMSILAKELGYTLDINESRYHHEIYLNDPRKVSADKLKTIIRHPIKKI